jgi:hypothetical protein
VLLVLSRPGNDRRIGQDMILLQLSLGDYPLVTPKSTRSVGLFQSDDQYVGFSVDRYFKLFLSIVLSTSHPLGVMSLYPQSVCLAL